MNKVWILKKNVEKFILPEVCMFLWLLLKQIAQLYCVIQISLGLNRPNLHGTLQNFNLKFESF